MMASLRHQLQWPSYERPTIGTLLQGTYRIERPLAEGGCGEVFAATHARLSCEVAVKLLHRELVEDVRALTRFRQEAEITSALRHPHIVQVFDFNVTEEGVPFLVMELLEGRLLSSCTAGGRPFRPRAAARVVAQVAQALRYAHEHGVVHRDLKPDNIILVSVDGSEDFVKVIDFGISQASWGTRAKDDALVLGTPEFMAPEQACGLMDQIDHRTDQFSLSAVAYAILTGADPFRGADPVALLRQVVNDEPPPPSQLAPWLTAEVDAVIARGMSKRAEDRYSTVTAFAAALTDAIGDLTRAPECAMGESPIAETVPGPAPSPETTLLTSTVTGADTLRFVRKARGKIRRLQTGSFLLALTAAAAFGWFCPGTREQARANWTRAQGRANHLIATVRGVRAQEPSRSGSVSMP